MVFVDTNFVIAWVNQSDELHPKALELLEKYHSEEWLTTDCVLLEVGNSLARGSREKAVEIIENFLAFENITVVSLDPDLFGRSFELYRQRMDKAWGMIDCVSFVVMREFGVREALAYDDHFRQAGFSALMRDE